MSLASRCRRINGLYTKENPGGGHRGFQAGRSALGNIDRPRASNSIEQQSSRLIIFRSGAGQPDATFRYLILSRWRAMTRGRTGAASARRCSRTGFATVVGFDASLGGVPLGEQPQKHPPRNPAHAMILTVLDPEIDGLPLDDWETLRLALSCSQVRAATSTRGGEAR
jgi:hypothetical protein